MKTDAHHSLEERLNMLLGAHQKVQAELRECQLSEKTCKEMLQRAVATQRLTQCPPARHSHRPPVPTDHLAPCAAPSQVGKLKVQIENTGNLETQLSQLIKDYQASKEEVAMAHPSPVRTTRARLSTTQTRKQF